MICTAQQQADFWTWQVEIGHGDWEARLCMRGIAGLPNDLPQNTYLGFVVPQPDEMYDEKRRIVFGAARLKEHFPFEGVRP